VNGARPPDLRRARARLTTSLAALAALACAGCSTQRTLTIDSEPGGAEVWVNGRHRGTTPVDVSFVHPGTWSVRLEKKGYASLAKDVGVRSQFHDYPLVDLPYELSVRRRAWRWVGRLTPLPERPSEEDLRSALERAEAFRERTRREVTEADVPPRSGR
jgi:hypothetical protein